MAACTSIPEGRSERLLNPSMVVLPVDVRLRLLLTDAMVSSYCTNRFGESGSCINSYVGTSRRIKCFFSAEGNLTNLSRESSIDSSVQPLRRVSRSLQQNQLLGTYWSSSSLKISSSQSTSRHFMHVLCTCTYFIQGVNSTHSPHIHLR